jgi:hypothetical protein
MMAMVNRDAAARSRRRNRGADRNGEIQFVSRPAARRAKDCLLEVR